jgi:hypothetical protein
MLREPLVNQRFFSSDDAGLYPLATVDQAIDKVEHKLYCAR